MLKAKDIRAINFEMTSRCNAACPFCSRNQKVIPYGKYDISLPDTKRLPHAFITQLERVSFSGNFGDFCCNTDFVDIVAYLKSVNPELMMDGETNGSVQDENWWYELGSVFQPGELIFALDGLADTHGIHRRQTHFDRVTRHLAAFASGGGRAFWKFIVFEHNEHQIQAAESMAKDLGCSGFMVVSSRDYDDELRKPIELNPEIKRDIYQKYYQDLPLDGRKVLCKPYHLGSIYIAADGTVHPCCFAHCMYISEHNQAFGFIAPLVQRYLPEINFKTRDITEIIEGPYFKAVGELSATNTYCQLKCNRYRKEIRRKLVLYSKSFN